MSTIASLICRNAGMNDWDHLRVFAAAARADSLSAAGAALGLDQTTVSRRVRALESSLGVKLLERTKDGLTRTRAGEEVLAAVDRMQAALDDMDRRVLGQDARLTGELRVTTTEMTAFFEAELFADFSRRYPGVDLALSTSDLPRNITKREADVAVRWSNRPPETLVGRKLTCAEYGLYAAAGRFEDFGDRFDTLPWLGWEPVRGARITEAWMRNHVPEARVVCRFDSAVSMHAAVRAGLGVSFLPCAFGDADPSLTRLRGPVEGFGLDVWVLTHADLRRNARVRAFMDHAARHFERRRAAFAGAVPHDAQTGRAF